MYGNRQIGAWRGARRIYGPLTRGAAYSAGLAAQRAVQYGLQRVGRRAYDYMSGEHKEAPRSRKRYKKNAVIFRQDGQSGGKVVKYTKPRRRKKKKSLRKQIAQVRSLIPKSSTKTFRDFETWILRAGTLDTPQVNHHTVFDMICFDAQEYDQYLAQLTKVDADTNYDYGNENASVKMDLFYKLMVKNNMTSNAIIKYAFVACKDDDSENYVSDLREELITRGYPAVPAVSTLAVATATRSAIPDRITFTSTTPYHVPIFSGTNVTRKWNIMGVKSVILGPGDTMDMVWSKKNFVYKPEVATNEVFANHKGYTFRLVVSLMGDLIHDQANPRLIGRGDAQLDTECSRIATVRYANPKGLKEIVYSDTLGTGITVAQHADNHASAMEADEN